jgi:hypothetical protein
MNKGMMMNLNSLQIFQLLANVASILTAVVAVWAYLRYVYKVRKKRIKLETYLKAEKDKPNRSMHTVEHLISKLGMTEEEILKASFDSSHIARKIRSDAEGLAGRLLFEYSESKTTV